MKKYYKNWKQNVQNTLGAEAALFLNILDVIQQHGGVVQAVGGWVRDLLLGCQSKDLDVEIYHLSIEQLKSILSSFGKIDLTGEKYGVLKLHQIDIDFALPRRDEKQGTGHKGFDVKCDPEMSRKEAASRRDFTVNAIALDLSSDELIDPYQGLGDLEKRLLAPVNPDVFGEDPLRVYRAAQLLARLDLKPSSNLIKLCRSMTPETIPGDRIYLELNKLLLKGMRPSVGLSFLKKCGWIRYLPELEKLIGCHQDKRWHPEGDVWNHTLKSLDEGVAYRINDEAYDKRLMYSLLCLNLGKPLTQVIENNRIRFKKHERAGVKQTQKMLKRITGESKLINEVCNIVEKQLVPRAYYFGKAKARSVKRLAQKLGKELNIETLVNIARACRSATGLTPDKTAHEEKLIAKACKHKVHRVQEPPVILGRDLNEAGIKPGPEYGKLLDKAYQIQIREGLRKPEILLKRVLDRRNGE